MIYAAAQAEEPAGRQQRAFPHLSANCTVAARNQHWYFGKCEGCITIHFLMFCLLMIFPPRCIGFVITLELILTIPIPKQEWWLGWRLSGHAGTKEHDGLEHRLRRRRLLFSVCEGNTYHFILNLSWFSRLTVVRASAGCHNESNITVSNVGSRACFGASQAIVRTESGPQHRSNGDQ